MSSLNLDKKKWYLRRMASMSLPEVGYRVRQRIRNEIDRLVYLKGYDRSQEHSLPKSTWDSFHNEKHVCFFFKWGNRDTFVEQYHKSFPTSTADTVSIADDLLNTKIRLFNNKFDIGKKIDWHTDPLTQRRWPLTYWADIDTRDGFTVGGVKWVWELNRHHHLVTLGKAYFLTGNEKYVEQVCRQFSDWIDTNPPYRGVNWTSPLELAIRLINWCWALAFIRGSPVLTPEILKRISYSAREQALFIEKYLSAHSSANNHLVGEAAGLAIAGYFFSWLPESSRWRKLGFEILEKEILLQISPEGVPREQATSYLAFILDLYLHAWRLAELNGRMVSSKWKDRFFAACNFINHLMDCSGNVPNIGDCDDAYVVCLSESSSINKYQSILASAALIYRNPEFKGNSSWDEKSHWMFGIKGEEDYRSLPKNDASPPSWNRKDAGYCIMRSAESVITFDCGPLGYLSTAAHGHADALSITLNYKGQEILVDPGTYLYQEAGPWRQYFRSTLAHNTVVVDGQDQSEMQGSFLWGRKANAQLERWETNPKFDLASASHDGYRNLGVIHRRSVLFYKPDLVLVKDILEGKGTHHFTQLWHPPPGARIESGSPWIKLILNRLVAFIIPLHQNQTLMEIKEGEQGPIQGWVSPHYGLVLPAPVIEFSRVSDLPLDLLTVIYLPADTPALNRSVLLERIDEYKKILEESI